MCTKSIQSSELQLVVCRLLNCWMSRWCSKTSVGFIDNWSRLKGMQGIHSTWDGAAFYCNTAHSLRTGLVNLWQFRGKARKQTSRLNWLLITKVVSVKCRNSCSLDVKCLVNWDVYLRLPLHTCLFMVEWMAVVRPRMPSCLFYFLTLS